jgi:hypothetical protein
MINTAGSSLAVTGLMTFIKNHLTKFQFLAAFVAITLGAHQVHERFIVASRPVLTWNVRPGNFFVSSGSATDEFRVQVTRTMIRTNCSLRSFNPFVVDSNGFSHSIVTSASRVSLGQVGQEQSYRYVFKLENPTLVSIGEATLRALLTYDCPSGQQVIEYPDTNLLEFHIRG